MRATTRFFVPQNDSYDEIPSRMTATARFGVVHSVKILVDNSKTHSIGILAFSRSHVLTFGVLGGVDSYPHFND